MDDDFSLERLEDQVMGRIALHRRRPDRGEIPTGVVLTMCALLAGLGAGYLRAQRYPSRPGSESAVLAEDASIAPSALLTTAP